MQHTCRAAVMIRLLWNDTTGEFEINPVDLTGELPYPDDHKMEDTCGCENANGDTSQEHDEIWNRAMDAPLPTAEDLAQMLGSALAQTVRESNRYVEHRPASPALIGMLKDKIQETVGLTMTSLQVGEIVQKILPIVSSVDQNAHLRGVAEGRTLPIPVEVDRDQIRAAISNAYYDARNEGKTMDVAADRALAGVLATLGVSSD